MKHTCHLTTVLAILLLPGTDGSACGPWFPRRYLENGGKELLQTPQFFAELELKLLAREYPVPFAAVRDAHPVKSTGERDLQDFDAALNDGSIRPADAAASRAAHQRMRGVVRQLSDMKPADAGAVPLDTFDDVKRNAFPSEFADYHEGAIEYACGRFAEARVIWERLLARPADERRYRSVQAAFMIGVLAVVEQLDDAPKWLAMGRELAGKGFRDSGGLAAATYEWESQWHNLRGEYRQAAENALRSISAGYPTRDCIRPRDESPEELAKFAADPLLRRITTVLLLASCTRRVSDPDPSSSAYEPWLRALEAAQIRDFAGAERIAWMCYDKADYAGAKRWLARAPEQSAESLWLAGKLAARDGRRAEAMAALSKAARLAAKTREPDLELTELDPDDNTTQQGLSGDHGLAAINVAEFSAALDAFLRGGHWADAAFVAERLLTIRELGNFIAKRPWQEAWWQTDAENIVAHQHQAMRLRWLLGRRLARAGHLVQARDYLPPEFRPALDAFSKGLAAGENRKLSREARAMALWSAALEARYNGFQLFGTGSGPDWFSVNGSFDRGDFAQPRTARTAFKTKFGGEAQPLPVALRPLVAERKRIAVSAPPSNKRFHYRYSAADIAWRAAQLLPANDPRLAEVLNLAGRWLAPRDPQAADRFYQDLESRCAETEIGKRATERRWFVEVDHYTIPRYPVATRQE